MPAGLQIVPCLRHTVLAMPRDATTTGQTPIAFVRAITGAYAARGLEDGRVVRWLPNARRHGGVQVAAGVSVF